MQRAPNWRLNLSASMGLTALKRGHAYGTKVKQATSELVFGKEIEARAE
jgi:hypothetical protein